MFTSVRRRVTAVLLIGAGVVAALTVASDAQAVPAAGPGVTWRPCAAGTTAGQAHFECGSLRVPLDWTHPSGRQISLAIVRHPAAMPTQRIGTLFMNPGGPGGFGTVQIPAWYHYLPQTVRNRFDVVSWDPRGMGASTSVQCFDTPDDEGALLGDNANSPATVAQQPSFIAAWYDFGQQCAARAGALLPFVDTASTARDLDRLRAALREPRMTYWGLSYGTILGATYANLFPGRLRAVVVDGNIAPSAWAPAGRSNPMQDVATRIGSPVGAQDTMNRFLTLCGKRATADCAFSGGSPRATQVKFAALLQRLRRGPITIGPAVVDYRTLVAQLVSALDITRPYTDAAVPASNVQGWPGTAVILQKLYQAGVATKGVGTAARPTSPAAQSISSAADRTADPVSLPENFYAVACSDPPAPTLSTFLPLAQKSNRIGPLGESVTWSLEPCSTWPVRAAHPYRGPWDVPTSAPVLVVGNTYDPSTPYDNSVLMSGQLANARLLTVNGYGHTELLNTSTCANRAITDYLVGGVLPTRGTTCNQDVTPFAPTGR